MTEQQTPAPEGEAGDVAVAEEVTEQPEEVVTEGQEQDPPAEDKPEEGKAEDELSPSQKRRQRRAAQMERLRQEADEATTELEKVQQRLAKYEQLQQQQPPKESDFDDYAEYQAELAAYKSIRAIDERQRGEVEEEANARKKTIEQLEAQRQREDQENWQAQVEEGTAKYADFAAVALNERNPINQDMAGIILSSDVGADIAYHLGKNAQEAAQIARMKPLDMARAIGRIEASLSIPKARTATEAPAPISPVKPKASGALDPAKMSMDEYKKARAAGKIR